MILMIGKSKKILVVEDNKLLQQIYLDRLVKEGFTVLQAFSGPQATTMAANFKPDLILLDVMLPGGLNGFDVLQELRRDLAFKHTPIIMITDLKNEEQTAKSLGATDYLIKSDNMMDQVVGKVKAHLKVDIVDQVKKILKTE